uniref:Putative retrotransposon protein n=1 Tax=Phyllostachys edulis TaxID=38705 RepID=D3IVS1_PHYED|nr:putative retrotransposon protein [Phyllostachys edulis]
MNFELQKQYETTDAYNMIMGLKGMFQDQARAERFNTSKALFSCRLSEGNPVSPHVIKMIGHIESLEKLGFPLSQELATDVILQSLSASFEPVILNFHMNGMEKSMTELHGMLKCAEESIKKSSNHLMIVQKTTTFKKKGAEVYEFRITNNCCSIYFEDMLYGHAPLMNGFRYSYVYLMIHKLESFEKFKEFQNEVQNQLGKTIKCLRSDRGGEYLRHEFGDHLNKCGIVPQLTPPGTPQWNGVSERRNRTLLDMVRSMMSQSDLPLQFWGYALETVAFTLNRVPSKTVKKTPYEIWTGKSPGLSFLRKTIDMDENVHVHKARLVAKGFKQIQCVDYDEAFSPVAMLESIPIILAIAAYFDYEIWQMDVKMAFLNGNLSEDVYMTQPESFVDLKEARKVCKLNKSIYGLKQASRSWNIRFDEVVKGFDFIKNEEEPCVYKKVSGSKLVFLILYVDDILLVENDIPMLESVKTSLRNSFSIKDLGDASYILGIRIYRDRSKRLIGLSQDMYIDKVLKRFNMQDSKNGFLLMAHGINLSKSQCSSTIDERDKMSRITYASAIGSIMYAM